MRKRKINPQHLKSIISQDVKDEEIAVLDFVNTLKKFADEYLGGIMDFTVSGTSAGTVSLKLSVASYLIRLLCECGDSDELIRASLSLSDEITLRVDYENPCPADDVAYIVRVAKLAGFRVERDGNTLIFKADIKLVSIMHIYATSESDFWNMLVFVYKM